MNSGVFYSCKKNTSSFELFEWFISSVHSSLITVPRDEFLGKVSMFPLIIFLLKYIYHNVEKKTISLLAGCAGYFLLSHQSLAVAQLCSNGLV